MEQPQSRTIIEEHPIGAALDGFRASFDSICQNKGIPCDATALEQLGRADLYNLVPILLSALQAPPTARLLRASNGRNLYLGILALGAATQSDDFDFDRVKPLLSAVIADDSDDSSIWDQVYAVTATATETETTPPPPPQSIVSSFQQTPWVRNTSSFPNSSEHRKYVDDVLKQELGIMYVGLAKFWDTYFGNIAGLEAASEAFFSECVGPSPLFEDGWIGWPKDAKQDDVLAWFTAFCERLTAFAESRTSGEPHQRRTLARPNKPIDGSVGIRKMDIGFMSGSQKDMKCHWSQILVPGELKSNPLADKPSEAWLDIGRYAREVLAAQDTRRFVLCFTICGSLLRVWAFDRVGGIASEQFDINKDGLRFVFTVLGFLWMKEDDLGFDPTVSTADGKRFIEIERNGAKEQIILDQLMTRARCIAGRATTCWKAHLAGHPDTRLVIKDSWQYPERDEEGDLLREMTEKNVVNVARYYHHETVQVRQADDDVQTNIRRGLDVATATKYGGRPSSSVADPPRKGLASNSKKRPPTDDSSLPSSKRSRTKSPTTTTVTSTPPNRVHRRIILRDYGKPIYMASSRSALLAALEGCIEGHESLHGAGILHRDISINNLMINEDTPSSWPSFLIDLDLAIRVQRLRASGAKGKTGTRAFMAIGALQGEPHSFMHDLESFFWVLFWICVHYDEHGKAVGTTMFERWNYESDAQLIISKKGYISVERDFITTANEDFTPHYRPLIPWVNLLRREIFPNNQRWTTQEPKLYSAMRKVLCDAREDPEVLADV